MNNFSDFFLFFVLIFGFSRGLQEFMQENARSHALSAEIRADDLFVMKKRLSRARARDLTDLEDIGAI